MSFEDVLFKILVPLIAAFVGAILAFRYQRQIEFQKDKRAVIQTLMMYRNVGSHELDFIKALNVVDIVFHNDKRVREFYHTYLNQTRAPLFANSQWVETFFQLVHEMARCSGYNNLTLIDIRDYYAPAALSQHYKLENESLGPLASSPNDELPKS